MQIRKAQLNDAAGIAKVHVDSWKTTYQHIMPAEFLNTLSYVQRTDLWTRNIGDKTDYVVVAENNDGEIIGFGTASKRKTNHVENSGDLTSIYLLKEYQGHGIGKMLLKELFLRFRQLKYEKIFVEVLEENNTRFFYEYYGAKKVKAVEIEIGGVKLKELIYEWEDTGNVLEQLHSNK